MNRRDPYLERPQEEEPNITRDEMINELLGEITYWEHEVLVDIAKEAYLPIYEDYDDDDLEYQYRTNILGE